MRFSQWNFTKISESKFPIQKHANVFNTHRLIYTLVLKIRLFFLDSLQKIMNPIVVALNILSDGFEKMTLDFKSLL